MLHALMSYRIDKTPFLVGATVLSAALLLALLLGGRSWRSRALTAALGAAGALAGWLIAWLLCNVALIFGLPLTRVTLGWTAFAFGGLTMVGYRLCTSGALLRGVAGLAAAVFLVTSAAWVNVDFGAYRDLTDAIGIDPYPALALHDQHSAAGAHAAMQLRPGLDRIPPVGEVGHVTIPGIRSGFAARPALVYLPPVALTAEPPKLPVVEMFSGQPGAPQDMISSARVAAVLNSYAAAHQGMAPIVVIPDQLSRPAHNPMCVDSPLGASRTYLTVDVPNWIRAHLNVATAASAWAVAGYSQGGTCAIQFGAGLPQLFGSILDISGEVRPTIGADTVKSAFHGSEAAYERSWPTTLMREHAPYRHTFALFGYGTTDTRYGPGLRQIARAAAQSGMATTVYPAAGSGHDWNTVRTVIRKALPVLADHLLQADHSSSVGS